MVKATKEILENIGIENIFLSGADESEKWLLRPVELNAINWICSLDKDCFINNVTCNIKFNGEYIKIHCETEHLEGKIYRIEFTDNSSRDFKKIKNKIKELEKNISFLEKRKEKRYEIGIKGSQLFGIADHEKQNIIFEGKTLPCFFNNISYSGCNIITMQTDLFKFVIGDEIAIKLCLSNPLENIFMQGKIRSVALKSSENDTHFKFAILSVELFEPPLSWKKRLSDYIKIQEK